ncbi:MAG: response regulator, partial [Desulfobacteraceae bacterium]|nr:response regulator [Desulfobacteraceae bacterium]
FADEIDDDYSEIQNVSTSGILASEIINHAKPFFFTREEIIERAKRMGSRGLGAIPKQWFGVPLIIKKQVIGVIAVQSYTNPELYTQKDVGILMSVSEQIATAIEKKQSEENVIQSEKITRTLFSISNAVNTTDNLNDLYRSIYDSLNALIELPNFYIAIVDEEKKAMYFPFYKDEYDSEETLSFTVDDYEKTNSITTEVIESKKALFFKKEELKAKAEEKKLVGALPVIWLGIPLIILDKVIGVMTVQHYSDPEYFTEKDKDLFTAASDQIALAIDRKRSQEIIIEREKQISQLSKQTQEFSLVAASIISMKDEKEIFRYISKAIVKHSDFNRLIISYFIDKPPYREIIQYKGISKKEIEKVRNKNAPREYYEKIFKVSKKIGNLSWYLPHTDKAVLGNDLPIFIQKKESDHSFDAWHHEDTIFIRMNDSAGNFVGVISVDDSKSGKKPTNETVRPLEIFSSLISQIVIFRKIQNELKDHKENLEKMVDDRTKELTTEIAERIQIEAKLKKAKIAAEAAARIKSEFLTNMSHEIRTPINGIMGMAEIAMGNDINDDLRKIFQTIDAEAGSLLEIINQVLDFSKIEAGKMVLEKIPFDLRNTFERVSSLLAMGIKSKGIEFVSFLAPDVPLKLIGDPGRLRQVLLNLVGNAMKFTHRGEIFIKAEKVKQYKTGVKIRFIVKDTGIGIEKIKQKTIFDSFSQVDGSTTRKYGGTGLGTTISRQLVELMGGKIGLKSKIGKGSTFWFTVKFEQQKEVLQKKAEVNTDLDGLNVLLVDDNKTNQFVLIEYLKSFGIKPVVVENGKEGLKIIIQSSDDKKPVDAVIINLKHSNIEGFGFAAKIRENRELVKLPIILLASSGEPGDGQICKDIGVDAYLFKPVKQAELKKAIAAALYNLNLKQEESKNLITRHTIAEELTNSGHVLVVEDYVTNQLIAMKHLKSAGYQVTLAENGKVAVDLFKKKQFDVIMMDIQMPVM